MKQRKMDKSFGGLLSARGYCRLDFVAMAMGVLPKVIFCLSPRSISATNRVAAKLPEIVKDL